MGSWRLFLKDLMAQLFFFSVKKAEDKINKNLEEDKKNEKKKQVFPQ
jgi:hypothetical protein